jgi:hypothetical protein
MPLSGEFRTVCYNIDDVTDLVLLEIGGERDLEVLFVSIVRAVWFRRISYHSLLLEVP